MWTIAYWAACADQRFTELMHACQHNTARLGGPGQLHRHNTPQGFACIMQVRLASTSQTPLHMQVTHIGGHGAVNNSAMQCTDRSGGRGRLYGQDAEREARLSARRVHHVQRDQAPAEPYHPVCYALAATAALGVWMGRMLSVRPGLRPAESIMRSGMRYSPARPSSPWHALLPDLLPFQQTAQPACHLWDCVCAQQLRGRPRRCPAGLPG